jgi:hypothetical protein
LIFGISISHYQQSKSPLGIPKAGPSGLGFFTLPGKKSWFNDGNGYDSDCYNNGNGCYQYTTPMQYRCQKNYIILMTDGEPTYDQSSKLSSGTYINGDTIGDYDNDGNDPGSYGSYGSDYLDDVAKYLEGFTMGGRESYRKRL